MACRADVRGSESHLLYKPFSDIEFTIDCIHYSLMTLKADMNCYISD